MIQPSGPIRGGRLNNHEISHRARIIYLPNRLHPKGRWRRLISLASGCAAPSRRQSSRAPPTMFPVALFNQTPFHCRPLWNGFRSVGIAPASDEVVGARSGLIEVHKPSDQFPEAVCRALADISEHSLELGEGFSIGLKSELQGRTKCSAAPIGRQIANRCPPVARQVVHVAKSAGHGSGTSPRGDMGFASVAVDMAVQQQRCDHSAHSQPGNQRARPAVTKRKAHPQTPILGVSGHGCGSCW